MLAAYSGTDEFSALCDMLARRLAGAGLPQACRHNSALGRLSMCHMCSQCSRHMCSHKALIYEGLLLKQPLCFLPSMSFDPGSFPEGISLGSYHTCDHVSPCEI